MCEATFERVRVICQLMRNICSENLQVKYRVGKQTSNAVLVLVIL